MAWLEPTPPSPSSPAAQLEVDQRLIVLGIPVRHGVLQHVTGDERLGFLDVFEHVERAGTGEVPVRKR